MLAADRPGSDDLEVPAATDTPRSEEAAASSPDRRAVMADAGLRQEYALDYRAKVDELYERGEPDVVRGNAGQWESRPNIAEKYGGDYVRATREPPRVDGPHEPPEKWLGGINFDRSLPGRDNNCGECARAVLNTWYGKPNTAAAISDPDSGGESDSRMTEWAGRAPQRATLAEIERRLGQLGPGSAAIVGCDWAWPRAGGHWFNAVNDEGTVKAVDGQKGEVEPWPPSAAGIGFDESWMEFSDVMLFTPEGKVVRNDHS